jgi:endonuclease YncB( thermonuclease family)
VGKRHAIPKAKLAVAILAVLLLVSMERLAPPKAGRSASRSPRITRPWSDRCVGVADGDTISVMYKGREVRIRLNGVDSPERNQAFAAVARQFTSDMVFGKVVTVNPTATDRYGRTVADVLMPNGESLNEALVGAGLAWWFRRYAPNNTRLQELEAEARQAKRGLWRDANPIPPWEFRQGR